MGGISPSEGGTGGIRSSSNPSSGGMGEIVGSSLIAPPRAPLASGGGAVPCEVFESFPGLREKIIRMALLPNALLCC